MVTRARLRRSFAAAPVLGAALLVASCAPVATPGRTSLAWVVGQEEPRFDPTGPADPARWALERLLSEGLVAEDSTGQIVPAAAEGWELAPDSLTCTFHLRPGLRFADGRRCTAADFGGALRAGLNRVDHATYAWLLAAVTGVERVRAGRPLPPVGIEAPDDRTLVLRLTRADPSLLRALALPGASMPWRADDPGGGWGGGIGPYRLVAREPGRRMVLVRRVPGGGADTVRVEFVLGTPAVRVRLRAGRADLIWPLPPGLLGQRLPGEYRLRTRYARPPRRLWLVMRADLPPTTKVEARRALAHGLNRAELMSVLADHGARTGEWVPGGGSFEFPRQDMSLIREALDRGHLGRSLHVVMAYRSDGIAAELATSLQTEWAGEGLDMELRPLRGAALAAAVLGRGGAQLLLTDAQAPLGDPATELAMLAAPRRGPPVGTFRTGWSTPEFDRALARRPTDPPLDVAYAERRLEQELVALPLLRLPWLWVERAGGHWTGSHPRFGPDPGTLVDAPPPPRAAAGLEGH